MIHDLPELSVEGRIGRVGDQFATLGIDALVVGSLSNLRWLTGFTGSNGALVVGDGGPTFVTDSRYAEQAPAELAAAGCEATVVIEQALEKAGAELLVGSERVGLEADHVSWAQKSRWQERLGRSPIPTEQVVSKLRSVKDEAEIARMAAAAAVTDEALASVLGYLVPGVSEREIAMRLDDAIRSRGATGPAYDTIVAGGPNAARPHATPGDRPLRDGDLLVIDVGSLVDGYRSDMTRSYVIGSLDGLSSDVAATTKDICSVVAESQAAGVAAVRAGVTAESIDHACRSIIVDAGYGEAFGHGTGHGVGLDIHELPAVRRGNDAILQPGHVITVEPGIYLPAIGGVRVEDTVVVTETGCRSLTRAPKFFL